MTESRADAAPDEATPPRRRSTDSGLPSVSETHVVIRRNREGFYRRGLLITDLAILALTTAAAQIWHFGADSQVQATGPFDISYSALGAVIVAMWWVALQFFQTRDARILGDGTDEYRRISRATFLMFGWVAILSLMFKWDMSRGYLAMAFPLGLVGLLLGRKAWRSWLHRQRAHGRHLSNVLLVGGARSGQEMALWFNRHRGSGLRITGVWVPDAHTKSNEWLDVPNEFIPVMGNDRNLFDALNIAEADTVIVTDTEHLGHRALRDLTWQLEGLDIDLMVSPNVMDFAGSRIHVRAVAGMPLMHLEEPQYADAGRFAKLAFDKAVALVALIAISPLMLAIAVTIKLTSAGPALYRSTRVGVGGVPFEMLKFRTMADGSDLDVEVLAAANEGAGILFKIRDDPRVTDVGRFLRRYSLDEIPQLLNVLKGEMSIVGPRPPLPSEVALYEGHVGKRLLVKQGITGLWQVSGRSDLTWEETVRLDLDYVENWSMLRDLQIIWRTAKAVIKSEGAY